MRLVHSCDCHPTKKGGLFTPLLIPEGIKATFNPHAGETIASILESSAVAGEWSHHHRSRTNDNAPQNLAAQIRAIENNIHAYPELLAFMQNLVALEIGAMGKPDKKDTEDTKSLREHLYGLETYLHNLPHAQIKEEDLPEDHQLVLKMVREQTGQNAIRPMRAMWNSARHIAAHIRDDAKEHPKSFALLLTTSLGMLAFMNMRMGMRGSSYIAPEMMQITDLDIDTLLDPDAPITINTAEIIDRGLRIGCHDHLKMILGEGGADFVKNTLDAANIFPHHCARIKTLAQNAHENMNWAYDAYNLRLGAAIKDPSVSLAHNIAGDGTFFTAFTTAAHNTAEFIYAANTVENVVLHSIIFGSAMIGTVKLGQMEKEDFKQVWNKLSDFTYRTAVTKPMNYVLCASASAYAYMANGGYNPDMIWMGAGGLLAGEFAHKIINKNKAPTSLQDTMLSVPKDLAIFSDPKAIVSDERAHEHSFWRKLKIPALAAGLTSAAAAADIALTGGKVTGTITGTLGVVVPFLLYNIPEDAAFHVIFGAAGATVGGAYLAVSKTGKKMLGWVKRDDDDDSSPKPE